jgi:hypothetical protein
MVVKTYNINGVNQDTLLWISQQPTFQGFELTDNNIKATFDQDSTQEADFKKALADKIPLDGDNPTKYLDNFIGDTVLYSTDFNITKTNVGINYVNLYTDFGGRPFLVDTTGYTRIAVQVLWNKNAGSTNHAIRIIDNANQNNVLYENLNLINGENVDASVTIPAPFINFKGKCRIQCKVGNATDDPIFSAIRVYLRR